MLSTLVFFAYCYAIADQSRRNLMASTPLLRFKEIRKSFSGNVVLSGIDFSIAPGEIVALAGENGAGKSTLMNILFGMDVIQKTGGYEGQIEFEGKPVSIKSPHDAMEHGIGMVHQEFMLIPGFSIGRNIKLNRENLKTNPLGRIFGKNYDTVDIGSINRSASESIGRLGMDVDPETKVQNVSVGTKQFIEIAREINKSNLKLLVLDEPTAVLTETEAEKFIECIRKIADEGISVIFISHRLEEIIKLADRTVVLRDGRLVFNKLTKDTTKEEIAATMVGHELSAEGILNKDRKFDDNDIVLSFEDFAVDMPGEPTKGINLKVRRGEILGIGGLAGQGKASISNGVFGMYPTKGKVVYNGEVLNNQKTGEALSKKLAFVSEDRKGVGLLLDQSIALNVSFTKMKLDNSFLRKLGFFSLYDSKSADKTTKEMIGKLDIRCTGPEQRVGSLSGGNQQKVCVARALLTEPDVLFVSEPTRGIDIGAKQLLLDYLAEINRKEGITIVMTSSELKELCSICDRVAIITDGVVQGILPPDSPQVDFALLMSGEKV